MEEIFGVTVISIMVFLNDEGKLVENLSVLMNEWKERL